MHIGIIGAGNIGKELYSQVQALGWDIEFVLKKDGVYEDLTEKIDDWGNCSAYMRRADVVFLAISTQDDGTTAYNYLSLIMESGFGAVTCEKGALANYFPELEDYITNCEEKHFPCLAYNASVGGGTRMLDYLRQHGPIEEIHAVINGTMNFLMDFPGTIEDAVKQAQTSGYTEPGATDPEDVVSEEINGDLKRKIAILWNTARLTKTQIRARDLPQTHVTLGELKHVQREGRRYVVSLAREQQDVSCGFSQEMDGWVLSAGFQKRQLCTGVANALFFKTGHGDYLLSGPGAGITATVATMLQDARQLTRE